MSFSPAFIVTPTSNPAAFVITDTSMGSDGAITDRQILLYTPANALLVPAIDFPLSAGSSITIAPLAIDQALNVVVNWNNNTGSVLYTTSLIWAFVQYGLQFLQQLTQTQISNPLVINDINWVYHKFSIFLEIQSALNAINVGQSIGAAQSCINRYNATITNQSILF